MALPAFPRRQIAGADRCRRVRTAAESMNEPRHDLAHARAAVNLRDIGSELHERIRDLYPICRSITGDGVRQTLRRLGEEIDLQVREVPTGTPVFDWTIPKEWNVREAYIKNSSGATIVGTPGYAAPEQFSGHATPASDVYGLGATMLFVITHVDPDHLPRARGRFDLGKRLDGVDKRLDGIDKRLDGIDQHLEGIDRHLEGIDQRVTGLERRFDGLDNRLDTITSLLTPPKIQQQ